MIAILCNSKDLMNYYTNYYSNFKTIIEKNISIIFFTIDNIDLNNKKISGMLVSKEGTKSIKVQTPQVIVNFSKQHKKVNIKKLKLLSEIEELEVVNETNKFNQLMIMEILYSYGPVKEYILPYQEVGKVDTDLNFQAQQCFLIIPSSGSSLKKIIYLEQSRSNFEFGRFMEGAYDGEVSENKLLVPGRSSIIMKCPKLLLRRNHLQVVRVYLQKGKDGLWNYIHSLYTPKNEALGKNISCNLKDISLLCINHVNHYIPSLGITFIDFILDDTFRPYFLHLGGWDKKLLKSNLNIELYKNFCENLIYCCDHYRLKSQED